MSDIVADWISSDVLDAGLKRRLALPAAEGSCLPNAAYTSAEFHRREQHTVFRNTWVFAGFTHQLPKAGDVLPVEIAGQPLVLVRDDAGRVRTFHNVCRHRGAKLVSEARSGVSRFVCPNHSWSYGLDGRLLARPHFFGGDRHDVNRAQCHRADLVKVRCNVWHDWIFVNLGGEADDLPEHTRFIRERLADHDFTQLRVAETLQFDLNANWKLAIENFIEPYHVFACHPWLNTFVSMAEREPPGFQGHVLFCGYRFSRTDPARGEGLPYFPDLPEARRTRGDWFVLFPNFAFEIFPDQVAVFVVTPLGAGRCRETIALYFVGEGADGARYAEARERVVRSWRDLNLEDVGVVERMQAGRASDGFDGGVLSPYWDPVLQQFARLVADAV